MEDTIKDLPPIPDKVQLPTGMIADTSSSVWWVRAHEQSKQVKFDWGQLDRLYNGREVPFSPRSKHLIKLYIAHRLTQVKLATARANLAGFTNFQRWLAETTNVATKGELLNEFDWASLNEVMAHDYLDWVLKRHGYNQYYLAYLKTFYGWGVARQYPGFHLDIYKSLQDIRHHPNPKGHLVRSRNVTRGPLSSDEKTLILQAVKMGQGTDIERAVVMLGLELGLRPISITQLRNKHLRRIETSKVVIYQLDAPRAKKRNHQQETKRRPISEQLGRLLETIQGANEDELLFSFSGASSERTVKDTMKRFAKTANIVSPRTGKILHLTPRRLRYSLATHLAEAGASKFHIAEILDHDNMDSTEVYIETKPSIADQVASATDQVMTPLINRFLGRLVDSEGEQILEKEGGSLILSSTSHLRLPVLNTGGIGICGRNVRLDGLCQLFPPFSCYLCPSFLASRTGLHREQLDAIEQFILENENEVDSRIVMQLDEIRQAIREVLSQINSVPNRPETTASEVIDVAQSTD